MHRTLYAWYHLCLLLKMRNGHDASFLTERSGTRLQDDFISRNAAVFICHGLSAAIDAEITGSFLRFDNDYNKKAVYFNLSFTASR